MKKLILVLAFCTLANCAIFKGIFTPEPVLKYDYKTTDGIYIVYGATNRPAIYDIEQWTKWLTSFWNAKQLGDFSKINDAVNGLTIYWEDSLKTTEVSKAHAECEAKRLFISNQYQKAFFMHEVSHCILSNFGINAQKTLGDPKDHGINHHELFAKYGLGY